MGASIPINPSASLLRLCGRAFAALALLAAALGGAQTPPAERIHKLVAETSDLKVLNLGDKSFILANGEKEDTDKLWAVLKDNVTPVPGVVLEASALTIKIAFTSDTQDAKDTGSPVFIVRLKSPLAPKDIPPVGFKFTAYPWGPEIFGAYDSYTRLTRIASPNSVQITLRDGEIQLGKKSTVNTPKYSARATPAASEATSTAKQTPAHSRKRPLKAVAQPAAPVVVVPVEVLPEKPPEQEAPAFPIDGKPTPASVTWDSQGLHIEAANSSLQQIMKDVSTATGTKVEGLDADQRVFGAYGPGPARDVLSQLLNGSGFNVVMIGDQGQGTPRRIVLSSPHPGSTTPAAAPAQESDEETEVEEPPPPPQRQGRPNRPGYPPPGMPGHMPQHFPPGQQEQPPNGPQN